MKPINIIGLALIALYLMACDTNRVFDQNHDFKSETWYRDSTLEFYVQITDTLAVYNIYLNNRISSSYGFSNLYLFVDTDLPGKLHLRDTLECMLREPGGKPLGTGFGNVWSNKIPYRKYIRFPYTGNYKFTIEQAMRVDTLENILSAGIRIEKAKK